MQIVKAVFGFKRLFVVFISLIMMFSCAKKEERETTGPERSKEKQSTVVAHVGDTAITADDLKRYLAQRPLPGWSKTAKEDLDKRLDGLILEEVLYQEALRLELDADPDMRSRIRQMLTQKLIDEQINQKEWEREITDDELQEYYNQHFDEFNRPEQVRVADIYIAVPIDATEEKRKELREKADRVLAEALTVKDQRRGFGALIRKYSDTSPNYRKGDTGFFNLEGAPIGIDKNLAQAAFILERSGSMAKQVIEAPGGYHIIMLIGKRSAMNRSLDSLKKHLKQRIRREIVTQARRDYIETLKNNAEIQIHNHVLSEILAGLNKTRPEPKRKNARAIKTREGIEMPPTLGE